MIYYIMNDDLEVIHRFELAENDLIAEDQMYLIKDENAVSKMIEEGEIVLMPVFDDDL